LDLVRLKARGSLESGDEGYLVVCVDDLTLQAPLEVKAAFPSEIHLGYRPPVEFNVIIEPKINGTLQVEVDYYLKRNEDDFERGFTDECSSAVPDLSLSIDNQEIEVPVRYYIDKRKRLTYLDSRGQLEGRWVPIARCLLTKPVVSLIIDQDMQLRSGMTLLSASVSAPCMCEVGTAPHIKLSTAINQLNVVLDLVPLDDFISAHFKCVQDLRQFIKVAYQADVDDDFLNLVKGFYDVLRRYLVVKRGIDFDFSIQGGIIVHGSFDTCPIIIFIVSVSVL
jgi:hypothetical protein